MKRFGILAVAGVLAIVGCSKKIENQERAAEASQAVAKTVSSSLASGAKTSAPAMRAMASGAQLTHGTNIGMTWDGTYYVLPAQSHDGASWTTKMQFQDANGTSLGEVWAKHTSTIIAGTTYEYADISWFANWKKTRIVGTGSNADGLAASFDMTMTLTITTDANGVPTKVSATMSGSGTHKEPKNKVDLAMTMTNMTFSSTISGTTATNTGPDGTISFTGTVDDKPVSGSIVYVNGVGDGTVTVNDEKVTIHINADGSGTWTDSKGEKHNFAA